MQLPLMDLPSNWTATPVSDLPSWDAPRLGLDIETFDPNLHTTGPSVRTGGFIAGASFALEDGPAHYLPTRHSEGNLPENEVLGYLRDQAKNYEGIIVGANLNYDLDYLAQVGIVFPKATQRDVQVAEPLIDELQFSYSLDAIAKRHGFPGKAEAHLRSAASHYGLDPKADLWRLPARHVGQYATEDAVLPLRVLRRQERIIEDQDLWRIFDLECRLQPVLLKMKRWGIRVDLDKLEAVADWSIRQEELQLQTIFRHTGCRLKVGDITKKPPLLSVLESIGITLTEETEQGDIKLTADILGALDHPVADCINRARKVNKLRTTFVASIHKYLVGDRIHCTFNQLRTTREQGDEKGAKYGRVSCADPNLQNQPSRDDFADFWRSIYIPDNPGQLFMSADYCFSSDTEILTKRGFVLFPELLPTDTVAQYDGTISYAAPLECQRIHYSGEMVSVRGTRQVDLLMTPNHNCFLLNRKGKTRWIKARDYHAASSGWKQVQAAVLPGGEDVPDSDLVLTCAMQADGSWRGKSWRIWVGKHRKIERITKHVPFSNSYKSDAKGGQTAFTVRPELVRFLSTDKLFDREALLKMSAKSRLFFLNELTLWDGSANYYCSTVKENVEIAQEIAVLTGVRANMSCQKHADRKPLWTVRFSPRSATYLKTLNVENTQYDGLVYCVTMPNHTVVVRRNGRVCITGQSQQEPRLTTHFAEIMRLPKAREMAEKFRTDPTTDNHDMMTVLIHPEMAKYHRKDPEFLKIRKPTKEIFLGLSYGMGGGKMAQKLGLPTVSKETKSGFKYEAAGPEAQRLLNTFNRRVPYVKQLADLCEKRAKARGYILTILGRRCRFPRKSNGEFDWTYKAMNRLIQGSGGDQTKLAMVELDAAGLTPQLQAHDEVCRGIDDMKQAYQTTEIMEHCLKLNVPSRVDLEIGPSWGEAKEIA